LNLAGVWTKAARENFKAMIFARLRRRFVTLESRRLIPGGERQSGDDS
jgi:hypothetical protein